ncbi:MAG: CoB--CoM heterodisulfide reductase iron-sulfur subunit A family protein [Desulfobacterales bacterium]|uniref:CoB--CoM heterodisulfide reductase iron-sulfur subunit A family protein n=1 Tax=Candidatus Desulfaltia bathyphila TaxID=2841697 RepID=A0A8J6T6H9_9BACT|nr:CoB--CoM heterodisulfide reductase iron-sulfur subunit A family protein [Candidatus Desulfaltia bathyphila]MBL7195879.1 CoB--CoM heterodisulfide reductase iron-sulfur subunit A family protein [Desulfobacterales bacterium]MBL7207238.1 CoB--CoM heterodisulfide reductase iron-sulfur subunit A family protein [Desulfobacterales bacterium]
MTEDKAAPVSGSILVVGGGISGLTTALEAAEVGYEVFLVEKNPYLGGRVAQLNQYFPKLCPPTCGLEINFRRIKDNPRIKVLTLGEVEKVDGTPGNYDVTIKLNPRFVNEDCTACNECVDVCPVERNNEFNFNIDKTKAIYRPFEMSFPMRYVIDSSVCKGSECNKCVEACKYNAIDLNAEAKIINLNVGAIVWATGWEPYDAAKIDNLGFGKHQNIITNMMMERLAAPNGPTKGKILRPSDNKAPESIAFVQCAGSRDENHLPYCSYICCMASLKQTTYIRAQYPDAKVYIFYIDVRAPGQRYEKFYKQIKEDKNVFLIKGKVAEVSEDPGSGNITVVAENAVTGEKIRQEAEMVVLATGMQPTTKDVKLPADLKYNDDGFIINDFEKGGMFAAGCANKPADVVSSNQNATGMALKAIQTLVRK